jgi:tetratricopeptide (TPR) repeat protein
VLADLGHAEAAAERYRQVIELDPQYAAAWNNLGLSLAETGNGDEAIEACRRAVAIDGQSVDALFNLADALHETGDTQRRHRIGKPICESTAPASGERTLAFASMADGIRLKLPETGEFANQSTAETALTLDRA